MPKKLESIIAIMTTPKSSSMMEWIPTKGVVINHCITVKMQNQIANAFLLIPSA